jgi:hypothetical protein
LDDLVEDVSVLVDSAPEPVRLARDADHYLIEMPNVSWA